MSRRRKAIKRQVMPDPKFNDKLSQNLHHALCMMEKDLLLKK